MVVAGEVSLSRQSAKSSSWSPARSGGGVKLPAVCPCGHRRSVWSPARSDGSRRDSGGVGEDGACLAPGPACRYPGIRLSLFHSWNS